MICNECGNKHGKSTSTVSTYRLCKCDWCDNQRYCVKEYKFGLDEKEDKGTLK